MENKSTLSREKKREIKIHQEYTLHDIKHRRATDGKT